MDDKLNEIRRKISRLRADMLALQEAVRDLVNHDLDCSELSLRLLAMRAEMVALIRQRNAKGGIEACPDIAERLKQNYRPELRRKTLQEKTLQEKPLQERPRPRDKLLNKKLRDKSLQHKPLQHKTGTAKEKPGRSRALSI
jgi:hypothetical protein